MRRGLRPSHLFHNRTVIQPFDFPTYFFRCYEDPNVGLINLSYNQIDCDSIYGLPTSIHDSGIKKSTLFPNPATDYIIVKTEKQWIDKIMVIDLLGIQRNSKSTRTTEGFTIDIHELENGMYFILGVDHSGVVRFKENITKLGN